MKNKNPFLFGLLALCLSSCVIFQKSITSKGDILLPGFSMLPNPNELDKPGTIFFLDENKIPQPLGKLNVESTSGKVSLGELKGKRTSSLGFIAKFVGMKNLDANGDIDWNKDVEFECKIKEAKQERIGLLEAKKELDQAKKDITDLFKDLSLNGKKFYLITEAVKAKELIYTFNKSKSGVQSLNASLTDLASSNQKLTWDNSDEYRLTYKSDKELYTYMKVYSINVEPQITGKTKIQLGDLETNEGLFD